MEEILDRLIEQIKLDQRYLDYIEDIESLLKEYQDKLSEYEDLKKYEQYIDNQEIKNEIRKLKKEIGENPVIIDYYQKYHNLNDFLEQITKIVFGNISKQLDLSPYEF